MTWHKFNKNLGSRQKLPRKYIMVLVFAPHAQFATFGNCVAVGYLKFAASDKDSPYFITHGVSLGEVVGWRSLRGASQDVKELYQSARIELGVEENL